jgi:hypothetical protein
VADGRPQPRVLLLSLEGAVPRTFDYSQPRDSLASQQAWRNGEPFPRLAAPSAAPGEADEATFFGGGADPFDYPTPQFSLEAPPGATPYDNAFVDPVHAWLADNVRGPWAWLEMVCNNQRSVSTEIWIDDDGERAAFFARWGEVLRVRGRADEANARRKAGAAVTPGFEHLDRRAAARPGRA